VDVLDLEADPDERLADRVDVGWQAVDVGGQPGEGNTHGTLLKKSVVPVGRQPGLDAGRKLDASQN
jgi:hypothetical protein